MPLTLTRPLVFFDLETTGTDIQNDRIIEISLVKIYPNDTEEINTFRVNPQIPIPPQATAIHHITDADVANQPTFAELAPDILHILENSDLCGYNLIKFDFPLLRLEFQRNNIEFNVMGVNLIDPMKIFMKKEPRGLVDALRYYCGEELIDAHSAEADTIATKKILLAQIELYDDVPNNVAELSAYTLEGTRKNADIAGKLIYNENDEVIYNFGKHYQKRVIDHPDYAKWMIGDNFPEDTKQILRNLIK